MRRRGGDCNGSRRAGKSSYRGLDAPATVQVPTCGGRAMPRRVGRGSTVETRRRLPRERFPWGAHSESVKNAGCLRFAGNLPKNSGASHGRHDDPDDGPQNAHHANDDRVVARGYGQRQGVAVVPLLDSSHRAARFRDNRFTGQGSSRRARGCRIATTRRAATGWRKKAWRINNAAQDRAALLLGNSVVTRRVSNGD